MKVVHLVYTNADLTEGRGPMLFRAAFTERLDAEIFMSGEPTVQGSGKGGRDSEIREVPLFESYRESRDHADTIAKKKALAKLSDVDKKALGLKDC